MYWSRLHWRPIVNGQSGFYPPWYGDFEDAAGGFPDATAVAFLRSRGVRHVVVHGDLLPESDRALLQRRLAEAVPVVRLVAAFPESGDLVFEIR